MAKAMTINALMRKLQSELNRISQMKPEEIEPRLLKAIERKLETDSIGTNNGRKSAYKSLS